jgi:hypothetical protein
LTGPTSISPLRTTSREPRPPDTIGNISTGFLGRILSIQYKDKLGTNDSKKKVLGKKIFIFEGVILYIGF